MVSDLALIGLRAFFGSFVKYGSRPHFNCVKVALAVRVQANDRRVHCGRHIPRWREVRQRVHRAEDAREGFSGQEAGVAAPHGLG
jgi:hypothetical protein